MKKKQFQLCVIVNAFKYSSRLYVFLNETMREKNKNKLATVSTNGCTAHVNTKRAKTKTKKKKDQHKSKFTGLLS